MKAKEHPGCRSWAHTQGQSWDRSHFLTRHFLFQARPKRG